MKTRKRGGQLDISEGYDSTDFEIPTLTDGNSALLNKYSKTARSISPISRQAAPSFRKFKTEIESVATPSKSEDLKAIEPSRLQVLSPSVAKQSTSTFSRGIMERNIGTRRLSAGRKLRRRYFKPRNTVRRKRSQRQ